MERLKNLEFWNGLKTWNFGMGKKRIVVEADLSWLPEDIRDSLIEDMRPNVPRVRPENRDAWLAAQRAGIKRRKQIIASFKADLTGKRSGVYTKDLGRGDAVLQAAGEWVTSWELRQVTGLSHGAITMAIDRLWHKGLILKRLNAGAAENRRRAVGPASCLYQYKRVGPTKENPGVELRGLATGGRGWVSVEGDKPDNEDPDRG